MLARRRTLSWSSALQGIQNDRTRLPAGVISAKSYTETLVRIWKMPLVTAAGAYDRSAIMTMAIEAAKAQQARTGEAWSVCMSSALRGAWMAAQYARHRSPN